MKKFAIPAICLFLIAMYALVVLLGLGHLSIFPWGSAQHSAVWAAWQAPQSSTIPTGPAGESIRLGMHLFNETPLYAAKYTQSRIACGDCHIAGGTAPYAAPVVGAPTRFPQYSGRAGRNITLHDRIQECFTRSENGLPLPDDSAEMTALVAYMQWLSQPQPARLPFLGRGLLQLPRLTPNPAHGAKVYAVSCAGCHGADGAGSRPLFPPLWGPLSFNDGAGMDRVAKLAAFVQANMPQNRKGILSAQDAWDVAAYLHAQPRPAFNSDYAKF